MTPHARVPVPAVPPGTADDGFTALVAKITAETSFGCSSYKERCLRRRIAVRMRARSAESYPAYAQVLDSDTGEYLRLLDALTVNVTRFFRDRVTFDLMAAQVIPALWQRGATRVWSAGTASGEEAYSVAALFHQHAHARGEEEALARVRITGTDIDRASLDAAHRACYALHAFAEMPPELLDPLFPALGESRGVSPALRAMVRFERGDLLRDPPPAAGFDLIVCRNVIIYLGQAAQEELLLRFHRALAPGGFLVLGRVETVLGAPRRLFAPVSTRERVYRRVA